jgi:hypothetical protein
MPIDIGTALLLSSGVQLVSGVLGADAATSAADTQAAAGRASIEEQRRQYDTTRADLAPYRQLGTDVLPTLRSALGLDGGTGTLTKPFSFDVTQDPGYQFRLGEGTKAIENSGAARGMQLSGATLKELLKYGQDYASGEFNQAFQRDQATKAQLFGILSGTAGMGQGATNTQVQAGQASAANIGNTLTGIGNVQAAGQIGSTNAVTGALTGAGNTAMNAYTLRQILNPSLNAITAGVNLPSAGAGDVNASTG